MKNIVRFFWWLPFLYTLAAGCTPSSTSKDREFYAQQTGHHFAYDLSTPEQKFFMGFELEEISGMSYYGPGLLACVQDEEGKLYIYDLSEKSVRERVKFASTGDYEGVEIIQNQAYVLRSDGQVFQFPITEGDDFSTTVLRTPLSIRNDTEGLGYDPASNQLLIACKGKGEMSDGEKVKGKAIYALNLTEQKLSDHPLFTIKKKDIEKFLKLKNEKHKAREG